MREPRPDADVELSVLVVNWNTREMTLACLRSLYAETARVRLEVILVDNGSADGSAEAIAAEFPQVRLLAEPMNHGFSEANNIAAGAANGRYLLLLNTDTLVLDGAVDRLVEFARKRPDAGIWGGKTVFADGSINPTSYWGRITPWSSFCLSVGLTALAPRSRLFNPEGVGRWSRTAERQVDIVSGCFFLIEAALWRRLGGFDRSFFMYGEEADLCARARAEGARPMISNDAVIVHHGGASASRRTDTIAYVFGARIGLVNRHIGGLRGRFARAMIIFAAFWRSILYGVAARLLPRSRLKAAAEQWKEVWERRGEWKNGPPARTLDASSR
jgi:GT2 family glycosyltransferase